MRCSLHCCGEECAQHRCGENALAGVWIDGESCNVSPLYLAAYAEFLFSEQVTQATTIQSNAL